MRVVYNTLYEMRNRIADGFSIARALEDSFTAFFVVDISTICYAAGPCSFRGASMSWSWFDVSVVASTLFSQIAGQAMRSWTFLRALRSVRAVSAIRMVRLLQQMGREELRLMPIWIMGPLAERVLCEDLVLFIEFHLGIYFVQVSAPFLRSTPLSLNNKAEAGTDTRLESIASATVSLVMCTAGGNGLGQVHMAFASVGDECRANFWFYLLLNTISLCIAITRTLVGKALIRRATP